MRVLVCLQLYSQRSSPGFSGLRRGLYAGEKGMFDGMHLQGKSSRAQGGFSVESSL